VYGIKEPQYTHLVSHYEQTALLAIYHPKRRTTLWIFRESPRVPWGEVKYVQACTHVTGQIMRFNELEFMQDLR
jgi:hypothetical protein